MSHADKADNLLIKPTAGARPASPCTPGRFIRKARTRGLTPDESRTTRTTPPWQRPLTDRPNDSHIRPSGSPLRAQGELAAPDDSRVPWAALISVRPHAVLIALAQLCPEAEVIADAMGNVRDPTVVLEEDHTATDGIRVGLTRRRDQLGSARSNRHLDAGSRISSRDEYP